MTTTDTIGVEGKCACGRPATANGRECPKCFRNRLLSVSVDTQNFDTAERDDTYFDRESVANVFGEDARERMMEDTQGAGYARTADDGTVYHRNRKTGDVEAMTESQIDGAYLDGL